MGENGHDEELNSDENQIKKPSASSNQFDGEMEMCDEEKIVSLLQLLQTGDGDNDSNANENDDYEGNSFKINSNCEASGDCDQSDIHDTRGNVDDNDNDDYYSYYHEDDDDDDFKGDDDFEYEYSRAFDDYIQNEIDDQIQRQLHAELRNKQEKINDMLQQQMDEAVDRDSTRSLLETIESHRSCQPLHCQIPHKVEQEGEVRRDFYEEGNDEGTDFPFLRNDLMYNVNACPDSDGSSLLQVEDANRRFYHDDRSTSIKANKETKTSSATTIDDAICKAVENYRDRVHT